MLDVKIGDSVLIKREVVYVDALGRICIKGPDIYAAGHYEPVVLGVVQVIPAPVTPKAGETWLDKNKQTDRVIVFSDDRTTLTERCGVRECYSTKSFISQFYKKA